jgi:hypothetical protein
VYHGNMRITAGGEDEVRLLFLQEADRSGGAVLEGFASPDNLHSREAADQVTGTMRSNNMIEY